MQLPINPPKPPSESASQSPSVFNTSSLALPTNRSAFLWLELTPHLPQTLVPSSHPKPATKSPGSPVSRTQPQPQCHPQTLIKPQTQPLLSLSHPSPTTIKTIEQPLPNLYFSSTFFLCISYDFLFLDYLGFGVSFASSSSSTHLPTKVVDKEALAFRKKFQGAEMEKEILGILAHPFLPTLYAEFDALHYSHLIMEFGPGGDLQAPSRQAMRAREVLSFGAFNTLFQFLPLLAINRTSIPILVEDLEIAKKKTINNARLLSDLILGSFYKRLFSARSIDVFYFVCSLHWLTRAPETVMDKISAAYNRGEVCPSLDLVRNTESVDPTSFLLSCSTAGVFQCSSLFGFILAPKVIKESWNAMLFAYIWVGKSETQCPGQCAWPFHQPIDGPPVSIYDESGILERLIYKGESQHRRCLYFQYLSMLRRNEKLLQSARLGNILNGSEVFKKFYPLNDEIQNFGSNVEFKIQEWSTDLMDRKGAIFGESNGWNSLGLSTGRNS
ncbi:hypothetical protein NE237_007692 [Protea cynaroides]|uniref:non-specific serine/threonine protein kinase n=1 Tax=Protea cynaroides TaxID=273540 RepID=A0A9Q0QWF6_9MAGN|nr:hypothetical protein NE237_007692 [Protea cynaroides]